MIIIICNVSRLGLLRIVVNDVVILVIMQLNLALDQRLQARKALDTD